MEIEKIAKNVRKRIGSSLLTGFLALAAITSSTKEATAETTSVLSASEVRKTEEVSQRKKLFETAVRANLSKREIARYVDFPEYIFVDKDGQLDVEGIFLVLNKAAKKHPGAFIGLYRSYEFKYDEFEKDLETFWGEIVGDKKLAKKMLDEKFFAGFDGKKFKSEVRHIAEYRDGISGFLLGIASFILIIDLGLVVPFLRAFEDDKTTLRWFFSLFAASLLAGAGAVQISKKVDKELLDSQIISTYVKEGMEEAYHAYLDHVIDVERKKQDEVRRKRDEGRKREEEDAKKQLNELLKKKNEGRQHD